MTVYRYRKRYKTVREALERERTDLVYEMRDRLKDQARSDDVSDAVQQKAILKLLEVFDDDVDWSDSRNVTHKGDENSDPIKIIQVNDKDE
jgi:hypothetical protein